MPASPHRMLGLYPYKDGKRINTSHLASITASMDAAFVHIQQALDSLSRPKVDISSIAGLSMPEAPAGGMGYVCWSGTQCGLCSRFLDRHFKLNLFLNDFVVLGGIADLIMWSQAGQRCPLCVHLLRCFIEVTNGAIPPRL